MSDTIWHKEDIDKRNCGEVPGYEFGKTMLVRKIAIDS